jgi:hypothetical protein
MPKILSRLAPALLGLAACAPALAQDGPVLGPLRTFMSYEVGQFEGGTKLDGRVDKELISHAAVWTLQEATLNEHARARFGVGGAYYFVLPRNLGANPYVHSKRSAFGLTEAHGEFDLLEHDADKHLLRLKAGIFGYKYGDSKNLGEYMFRTWTYPNVLTTGGLEYINSAAVQLSGLSASTKVKGLKNDLILSIESDRVPIFGLNLTDIVSYNVGGVFEVGAGFMFNNFYNPDENQVTPKGSESNKYYTLADGREISHDRYIYEVQNGLTPDAPTDTGYYTFAGQKVMVRASLDIGKLAGLPVAPNSFKLYGEAIVLGLKDYPTYYEKIQDRIVYMGGVNLPSIPLPVLRQVYDLLSVEVEYAPNPWENSTDGPLYAESAIPKVVDFGAYRPFDKDDIKWTVVARKDVYPGFWIYAQVANDHIRMLDQFSTPDTREFLTEKSDWYWAFKLAYAL